VIRIKNSFWIIIGLLSVLVIVTLPPGLRSSLKSGSVSVFRPVLTATAVTVSIIGKHTSAIFSYSNILNKNKQLRQRISDLEEEVVALRDAKIENQRLRALLSFTKKVDWPRIPARVVGRDSSVWFSSILIDKGIRAGIQKDMPVISEGGLTGRVVSTGTWASQVMLITDINSRVSIIVQRNREEGVAVGNSSNLLSIKYLSMDSDAREDDLVITSGLDGLYPKGLVVGKILRVETEPDGLTRTALVKPSVDIFKLEEVLCLDIESGS